MQANRTQIALLFVLSFLFLQAPQANGQGSLPTGWLDQDIGTVGHSGGASYSGGVFSVTGGGATFFGTTSDAFHFAYLPLSGDGTIVARMVSVSTSTTEAGVIIRETLTPGSTSMMTVAFGSSTMYDAYRTATGGTSAVDAQQSRALPYWIKVVRSGSTFTGYIASDGVNWVQLGASETISMAQNVYIGLGVTSQSTSATSTATFDNASISTPSSPAPVITGVSATTASVGSQVVISGSGFGASQGSSQARINAVAATINSWSASSITMTIPAGATSGYLVVSVGPAMNDSNPVDFTVEANPLPVGWLDQDIGVVGVPGSSSYTGGVFSVTGGGATLFGTTTDAFHFAYQSLSGDGTIVARVVNVSTGSTEAGVMIRETLTPNSTTMMTVAFGSSSLYAEYRASTGGTSVSDANQSKILPYWIKVVRSGSTFTGYIASDGVNWVQLGTSEIISMAQNVYIGLGVTSQSTSATSTATFDNVSISTPSSPAPVITGVSATTASVGSQVVISGSGFGASQGSSQARINAVAATINSWSASSITMTIPAGATSGYLVVSVGPAMNDSNPVDFTVEANPLPVGWLDQDIGVVGVPGSSSYTGGVFSVTGGGATLFGTTTDAFHFAYQSLSGDGTIVARVVNVSTGSTEAGVMIRETLTPNSTTMMTVAFGSSSLYAEYRASTGGTSVSDANQSKILPYWIKVVRSGSTFTGYIASDGVNWVQLGTSEIISMAQNVYIGLGVTSQSTSATSTATFDNVSISTPSNPAPVITGVSATTASVGSQVVISGSGFGALQGSSQARINAVAATINSWSASSITMTIPAGATSGYLVVSVGPAMNDSNPVDFTVETNPLPTGWLDQDVGLVGVAGSAGYSNGVFTISGAGLGVYNYPADSFHFAYQSLSGDGTLIARVVSVSSTVAMVGVMIRDSLDPSANSIMVADTNTITLDYFRTVPGVNSGASAYGPSAPAPYWVKLVRSQNTFVGYASPDGISWTLISGPIPIQMDQNVFVGLAVSSRYATTTYTATFDNVSISTAASPAPQITGVSATTGSVGSQVVISGSGFGASQGTGQVLINDSPMSINSWSNTSITITIASGATSGYLDVLVAPSLTSSNALYFTVTGQPLPAPWLDQDIGVVGKQGSATFANGVFTIQAAGGGVTGQADGFHFVFQPLTTDGVILARIVSLSSGTRAGVMIRENLDAYSAETFSYMYLSGTTAYGYMNSRPFEGGLASQAGGLALALPYYVRVVRAANQFTTYVSADGNVWNQIGTTQTVTTAQGMYVGIGVTSGNTFTLGTATIDSVSLQPGGSLANPAVTSISPNVGAPGQLITISGSGFGATQGTSTVQFNGTTAVAFTWSDSSILAMVPTTDVTSGPVSVTVGNITGTGPNFTLSLTAQLTDSLGHQTTYSSTINGGQWSLTNAQGSGCSSCTTRGNTQNLYDTNGNLIASTDAAGNIVQYAYDSNGNVTAQFAPISLTAGATTTYSYNTFGEVLTMTDPLGNVTYNTYDSHGNLLTVQTPIPKSGISASITHFAYNSLGELLQITDPLGRITTITYTANGFVNTGLIGTITDPQGNVTTYRYDSRGNRTAVIDALGHQTTFTYDAGNRLTMITYPDTTTTTFGYDYRGRRTSVTDQNGKTTSYAYDDADRLTSVTDAASNVTQYAYDTESNLVSITDANGHQTSFTHDAFGRVTQTTFPSNQSETYAYDAVNNLISKTDRKGQAIHYMYDALKRMTQKTYPDSTSVEYVYDLVGKVLQVNDPTGSYGFAYDNMGRLVAGTTQYSFVTGTYTTSYAYDANSNRTSMTDPQNGVTTYAYDTLNRLSTLTPPTAFGTGSFGFAYDALSRRTQMTRPNGVATNYTYDNLSRLLSVLHQISGSTIDGSSYTVDPGGNRTAKTDQHAGLTSNYTYDPLYELTQVTQNANTTESYTYDLVGNRLSSLGVSPYVNNTSNELTSIPNATYTYDYNGSATSKTVSGGTTNYTWDYENRLTSVTLPGTSGSITFKYDPFGRRIQKAFTQNSTTTTTNYLYDGRNAVADIDQNGNVLARYAETQNIDEPLAEVRSGTTSYYEADGLGSVTSLTSGAGAIANTYTYDSFGNLTASTGSLANRFQYTAREFDSESGLYYYRARYYDSTTSRFLSEDPLGFEANSVNFYEYAYNDPVRFVDSYGTQPTDPTDPCKVPGYCYPVGAPLYGPQNPSPGTQPPPALPAPGPPPGWDRKGGTGGLLDPGPNGGPAPSAGPAKGPSPGDGGQCKRTKNECWARYLEEKAFCSRYYGTPLYGMCRSRALARYEACRDGLEDPGPLDPKDWPGGKKR